MGSDFVKEINLATELNSVCNDYGREIDVTKSAPIFHEFGQLYRKRSPDKVDLIRSAVFFNAALTRQPSNHQFMSDLEELCSHVLVIAGVKHCGMNLISIAKKTQMKIAKMRQKSKQQLNNLKLIPVGLPTPKLSTLKAKKVTAIRNLQAEITGNYKKIMHYVSDKCIKLLGKPPCRYAITGMGSLARNEITPYSDFEHVIVLEEGVQSESNYQSILEYFKWFTVIFQIIVINLRETIIPSAAIPLLNHSSIPGGDWFFDCYTTRGISFDGMMLHACKFPLGRTRPTTDKPFTTELIKPVSEMAKYLQTDEDIKNGYHLADILTRTCFVSGSKRVYKEFKVLAQNVLDCDLEQNRNQVWRQLREDLHKYNAKKSLFSMGTSSKWNIKQVLYRSTTLFASALGRLHCIDKPSCFDIIDELLTRKRVIVEEVAEKLSFAVAVACETRLKYYMSNCNQHDYIGSRRFYRNENEISRQLCELIGEQSFGDYFLTAQRFQVVLRQRNFQNEEFLKYFPDKKFATLFLLDLHDLIFAEWHKYIQDEDEYVHITVCYYVAWAYIRKNEFVKALEIHNELEKCIKSTPDVICTDLTRRKAHCLCELERHEEGLRYIQQWMSKYSSNPRTDLHAVGYMIALQGDCERHLGLLNNSILSYLEALKFISYSRSRYRSNLEAKCYYFLAHCEAQLERIDDALKNARTALSICQGSHIEISLECKCNRLIGECLMHLQQPQNALQYFERELDTRTLYQTSTQDTCSHDLSTLHAIIQEAKSKINLKL